MKFKILFLFSLLLSLNACQKNKLKKPTKVSFSFDAKTDNSGEINIQESNLSLKKLNIQGKRTEGADIDFKRELISLIDLTLDGSTTYSELNFDIPQGNYTMFNIDLTSTDIQLNGKYKLSNGPIVSVIFELFEEKMFSTLATINSQNDIILDKKVDRNVNITFDFGFWLSGLTAADLDNADLIIENSGQGLGNSTILINSTNNVGLYNSMLNRINQNNTAEFN